MDNDAIDFLRFHNHAERAGLEPLSPYNSYLNKAIIIDNIDIAVATIAHIHSF